MNRQQVEANLRAALEDLKDELMTRLNVDKLMDKILWTPSERPECPQCHRSVNPDHLKCDKCD